MPIAKMYKAKSKTNVCGLLVLHGKTNFRIIDININSYEIIANKLLCKVAQGGKDMLYIEKLCQNDEPLCGIAS